MTRPVSHINGGNAAAHSPSPTGFPCLPGTVARAGDIVQVTCAPTSHSQSLAHVKAGLARIIANPDDGKQVFGFDPTLASRDDSGGRITTLAINGHLAAFVYSFRLSDSTAYLGGLGTLIRQQRFAEVVVRRNLEDRRRTDGRRLPVEAVVRLLPDGRINERSAAVLAKCGFAPTGIVVVDLDADAFAGRGRHLYASAEPDGHTIRTVKFVRRGGDREGT